MSFDSSRVTAVSREATRIYIEQGLEPVFEYCDSLNLESTTLGLIASAVVAAAQTGFFAGQAREKAKTQSYIGALIEIPVKSETRMPLESEPVKRDPQSLLRRLDTMPTIDPEGFRPGQEG